jgi:hypothetical protein
MTLASSHPFYLTAARQLVKLRAQLQYTDPRFRLDPNTGLDGMLTLHTRVAQFQQSQGEDFVSTRMLSMARSLKET